MLVQHPIVKKIAEKHGADGGQVLIAWGMHGGHASAFPFLPLFARRLETVCSRKRLTRTRVCSHPQVGHRVAHPVQLQDHPDFGRRGQGD